MNADDSYKKSADSGLLQLWKDRTFRTLLLAVLLVVVMGLLRPDKPIGIYPKKCWATKIGWKHCADAVLAGDSRVLMAVSPAEMQKVLQYNRIFNYGFGANWHSQKYLEAVENVLDPKSDRKAIIFGISPHSLTYRTDVMGHFIEISRLPKQDVYVDIHFGALVNFLEPMSFRDAFHGLFPSLKPTRTRKHSLADGWIAVNKEPEDEKGELKRYRGIFKERQVSDRTIGNVARYVSKWTQSGIRVYAFLVPTCKEMVELEANISGFNQEEFVAAFEAAGGIWIEVDQFRYDTFDRSHLQDNAALEFSRDLALHIRDIEREEKTISIN